MGSDNLPNQRPGFTKNVHKTALLYHFSTVIQGNLLGKYFFGNCSLQASGKGITGNGMRKTRKAFAKRFKVTASGKVLRRAPGRRHLMRNKSSRQLASSGDRAVSSGMVSHIMEAISAGM
jgi:large subunit ribosomal protein L35